MLARSAIQYKKDNGDKLKVEGLDWALQKTFSAGGGAPLQLVPSSAVGSPSFEVSKAIADPAHGNCPASSGRLD